MLTSSSQMRAWLICAEMQQDVCCSHRHLVRLIPSDSSAAAIFLVVSLVSYLVFVAVPLLDLSRSEAGQMCSIDQNFYISFEMEVNSSQTATRNNNGRSDHALHALAAVASALIFCCICKIWGNCAPICSWLGLQLQKWWCPTSKLWNQQYKACARVNDNFGESVAKSCIFQIILSKVSATL